MAHAAMHASDDVRRPLALVLQHVLLQQMIQKHMFSFVTCINAATRSLQCIASVCLDVAEKEENFQLAANGPNITGC